MNQNVPCTSCGSPMINANAISHNATTRFCIKAVSSSCTIYYVSISLNIIVTSILFKKIPKLCKSLAIQRYIMYSLDKASMCCSLSLYIVVHICCRCFGILCIIMVVPPLSFPKLSESRSNHSELKSNHY